MYTHTPRPMYQRLKRVKNRYIENKNITTEVVLQCFKPITYLITGIIHTSIQLISNTPIGWAGKSSTVILTTQLT